MAKPTGETDRQDVGIEEVATEAVADEFDELLAALAANLPDLLVVDVADSLERFLARQVPIVADHVGQQFVDAVAHPGPGMHAVGDVADRRFLHGERPATSR